MNNHILLRENNKQALFDLDKNEEGRECGWLKTCFDYSKDCSLTLQFFINFSYTFIHCFVVHSSLLFIIKAPHWLLTSN